MRAWLLSIWLLSAHALGQAPSDEDIRRARPHFEAGHQYYEDGDYAAALRELSRAFLHRRPAAR